nr:hypothetical protein [uncultured Aquabacterium sp.]
MTPPPVAFTSVMAMALSMAVWLPYPCAAQASPPHLNRTTVKDARVLMMTALQNPEGQAHGVLVGESADAISQRFKSNTPIFIDVTTEKRYRQIGCSRLKVTFWQDGVWLPGAQAPRKQSIEFGINYCLDGLPPKSLQ